MIVHFPDNVELRVLRAAERRHKERRMEKRKTVERERDRQLKRVLWRKPWISELEEKPLGVTFTFQSYDLAIKGYKELNPNTLERSND